MEETKSYEEKIVPRLIEEEMKQSYLDYSMSVIVGRALPDVRDGLKPVHRRILYAMNDMGMTFNKPFKKSARVVGEVLGKYHPHGDTAVYDASVRMVQEFSLRYPLIKGQGNFGSIDGDSAAAMRYTEEKMSKISELLLDDINKNTVKFVPNFDNSLKEPSVLPCKFPNLLVNGSSGIAVGMATNIPPHNLTEVSNAAKYLLDNPDAEVHELMNYVTGPDFPTAGYITSRGGIRSAYARGRGKVIMRAKTHIEEKKNRKVIIVDELPYQVNKSNLLINIANLVKDKKIKDISDLRDESDRDGIRVVIELKIGANPEVVLNQLLKHTQLQSTFGINMLALVNNVPRLLNLKQMLDNFLKHRITIVVRRTKFDLTSAQNRVHILSGLKIALDNLDAIIKLIKSSGSPAEANKNLQSNFELSEKQSQAVLDMKLQKLTSLEQNKIIEEYNRILELIKHLESILADDQKVKDIIKKELEEIIEKFGDERRTEILDLNEDLLEDEDLIKPEDVVVTITKQGYIKRTSLLEYKEQKRGGKGVIAAKTREEDYIQDLFTANTKSYFLFFTNLGKVYWSKVYRFPESARSAKGLPLVNLLKLSENELITSCIPIREFKEGQYIMMATKNGTVKKTDLTQFSHPRKGGIIAINLRDGDQLIAVRFTDGNDNIILATRNGKAVRFDEKEARSLGRNSTGVRGIKLKENDQVIGMVIAEDEKYILTITENGYGKRTKMSEYHRTHRGGSGIINIKCSERNGKVAAILSVDQDTLMFVSKNGITITTSSKGISAVGRNTQGVRIMKLSEGDKVVSSAKVISSEEDISIKDNEGETKIENTETDSPNQDVQQDKETIENLEFKDNEDFNSLEQ